MIRLGSEVPHQPTVAEMICGESAGKWQPFCVSLNDKYTFVCSHLPHMKLGRARINSIPIQVEFRIIQFQFKSDSEYFNSIPIQFIFFQSQFNSIQILCTNKQINQIIGYFKFNLNISLFAAQFWKYIVQDHKNSRINKSALVQVLG